LLAEIKGIGDVGEAGGALLARTLARVLHPDSSYSKFECPMATVSAFLVTLRNHAQLPRSLCSAITLRRRIAGDASRSARTVSLTSTANSGAR
jgi:hypothetical protein